MGKQGGPAVAATQRTDTEATRLAHSVCRDFTDLIAIFDQQLCIVPDSDGLTRSHLARTKAAAERGLKISRDLIAAMGH